MRNQAIYTVSILNGFSEFDEYVSAGDWMELDEAWRWFKYLGHLGD